MTEPEPIPKIHPLELPAVWLAVQALECGPFVWAYAILVPDGWPVAGRGVLAIAFLAALVAANYWLRRRLIPH